MIKNPDVKPPFWAEEIKRLKAAMNEALRESSWPLAKKILRDALECQHDEAVGEIYKECKACGKTI